MKRHLIPLAALLSFGILGWFAGYAYAGVSQSVGTGLGAAIGVGYAVWFLTTEPTNPLSP
jgi:hypothetical protein